MLTQFNFIFSGTLDSILVSDDDDAHWNTCMFDKTNSFAYFCSSVEVIPEKMLLRCLRKFGGIIKPWKKLYSSLLLLFGFFLFLICSPLLKQLITHYRVLKDQGVYVLVIAPHCFRIDQHSDLLSNWPID